LRKPWILSIIEKTDTNEKRYKRMDLEELKTLITLAECKNFTKAAKLQHVVQSTVSNRIRSLEEQTGVQLVVRDKAGIKLTTEGEVFLDYAKRIQELNDSAFHEIHLLKKYEDRLSVAGPQWIMDYFVKDFVIDFAQRNERLAVKVTIAHSEEIIPMLQDKIIDLAVIAYRVSAPDMVCIPFKASDIIFVGDAKGYKHLQAGIRKKELGDLPLIYSDIWENYLSEISDNILPDRRIFKMHCNMLSDAKEFCCRGIGCCFFPEVVVRKEIEDGRLTRIPIIDLEVKHFQIYIIYNKQRLKSKAMTSWLDSYRSFSIA
jgi:LysR family transcriptional repressor of citA